MEGGRGYLDKTDLILKQQQWYFNGLKITPSYLVKTKSPTTRMPTN